MSETKPEPVATTAEPTGAEAPKTVEALPIDWSTEGRPVYTNGAHVIHSARDFSLIFTEAAAFPGRLSADGKAGNERAAVAASLRMSPDVFFQMLCVFASNWNKFANEMIDPRMRRPRFKLIDAGDMQLDGVPKPRPED
jgi:hypothetical protein